MNPRIVICGNYGATNVGDEAILAGILRIIREASPKADLTVMSVNPPETERLHDVKAVSLIPAGFRSFFKGLFSGGMFKTLGVIKEADLFILGGGGLFTDEKPMAIVIWSLQARFARLFGVPVFCLGQSVGPLNTFFGRHMTRNVFFKAERMTVRDTASKELLTRLEAGFAEHLADPAFMLPSPEPLEGRAEPYVVFTLRPWMRGKPQELYKIFAQFIDWLWAEKGLKSVLIPFQLLHQNDAEVLNQVFDQCSKKDAVEVMQYTDDCGQIQEVIARSTAVVGMRLHSLIFATLSEKPFMAISYSSKVRDFARDSGMEDFTVDWESVTLEDLRDRFEMLTAQNSTLQGAMAESLMNQRMKARKHVEILRELLSLDRAAF